MDDEYTYRRYVFHPLKMYQELEPPTEEFE